MSEAPLDSFALLTHVEKIVDDKLEKHELENRQYLHEINERLINLDALIRDGFPGGDPAAHRRVHERYIVEAEERKAMFLGAKQKVLEGALWAGLVLMCVALWDYVKVHAK